MSRKFERISRHQWEKDCDDIAAYDVIRVPKRATKKSAGYDFYAPFGFVLLPGDVIKIPTGIKAFMNANEVLQIYPRSGLGFKYFVRLANSTGIIDADYSDADNEGHIHVKIRNEGDKPMEIKADEAFCQGIFSHYLITDDDNFTDGAERHGGFGSTSGNVK